MYKRQKQQTHTDTETSNTHLINSLHAIPPGTSDGKHTQTSTSDTRDTRTSYAQAVRSHIPDSYTHLEVYKRQSVSSLINAIVITTITKIKLHTIAYNIQIIL